MLVVEADKVGGVARSYVLLKRLLASWVVTILLIKGSNSQNPSLQCLAVAPPALQELP